MSSATLLDPAPADVIDPDEAVVRSRRGTPTWEIALLYPPQGSWTEAQYLGLDTNRLIEFKDGYLEFLPMPTYFHQSICKYLFKRLDDFVEDRKLGWTLFAPLRTRTIQRFIREPDIVFLTQQDLEDKHKPLRSARLVMEVVSPGEENRDRDLIEKRGEYAAAGIPEYWIVDPEQRAITVLSLAVKKYKVHGIFGEGQIAESKLLAGFQVDVTECLKAGEAQI